MSSLEALKTINMFAKKIRLKYYNGISEDIRKWREQGFKGEIIIYA